ncbi:MAG: hypothetical protein WBH57_09620 [Anaerolineae bacterium]
MWDIAKSVLILLRILLAQVGAIASYKVSPQPVKILFALLRVYVGLKPVDILTMLGLPL